MNYMFSTDRYLEILSYGVSKGSALRELVKLLNIKENKVVAIGDYCNDIEMIKVAFLGVATKNAHSELKEQPDA
ncbi:HAD family hydrolase [Caloramator sp. mosi_1]|uniref:HAD family hydrolase n=1 Tax=Caloramator sp. mosi_1 TaxID=3023090 RepID=UPI0023626A52|nr:HAD family hydrolase [Caloramator sp. mosi_1]WDC83624.1 HAD family hydrolase [Caloramator sp. mosi_1]